MRKIICLIAALSLVGCVHAPLLNGIQDCDKYPSGACEGRSKPPA